MTAQYNNQSVNNTEAMKSSPFSNQQHLFDQSCAHSSRISTLWGQQTTESVKLRGNLISNVDVPQQPPPNNSGQDDALSSLSFLPNAAVIDDYFTKMIEKVQAESGKEDLLNQIKKIDYEIKTIEASLVKLQKQKDILETSTLQPNEIKGDKESLSDEATKYQPLEFKINKENRRKAAEAHAVLKKVGPVVDLPLYNQPSDNLVYHENKRKYASFKKVLIKHLWEKFYKRQAEERYITRKYMKLKKRWLKKVNKIESSERRQEKQSKYREIFEKVFPELKMQTINQRDYTEKNLNRKDEMMSRAAIIPPLLFNSHQGTCNYIDNNGLIRDPAGEYRMKQLSNIWTKEEIDIFNKKFFQQPKKFDIISSFLKNKSTRDCVQYYYLNKKKENYKLLLRQQRSWSNRNRGKENEPNIREGIPLNMISSNNLQ